MLPRAPRARSTPTDAAESALGHHPSLLRRTRKPGAWQNCATTVLFLLLSVVLSGTGIAAHDLSPYCQNATLVSGATTMNSGFDARTGLYLGLPIWQLSPPGAENTTGPTATTTWSPPGDSSCVYLVPKLLGLVEVASSFEQVAQSFSEQFQQYFHLYLSAYSFEVGVDFGAMSAAVQYSKELMDVLLQLKGKVKVDGFSEHWWHVYRLTAYPAFLLDRDDLFDRGQARLPPTLHTPHDRYLYEEFVRSWGTHTPLQIDLGGSTRIHEYLDQSFALNYTMQKTVEQMKLVFYLDMFDISAGGFVNRSEIVANLDQFFLQSLNRSIFFSGGVSSLQANATLKEWVASIPYVSTPQNATFRSIADFVPDEVRAATLRSFIDSYTHNTTTAAAAAASEPSSFAPAFYLGHGVDLTTGRTGMLPWFDWTFDKARVLDMLPNVHLTLPDQLVVQPRTQSIWSSLSMEIQNASDYQRLVGHYSASASAFGIGGSSEQAASYLQQLFVDNTNLSRTDLTMTWAKVTLPVLSVLASHGLSPLFEFALARLPMDDLVSPSSWRKWTEFFGCFGPGVMDTAEVGGRLSVLAATHACYAQSTSAEYRRQIEWNSFLIFGDGSGHVSTDIHLDQSFVAVTRNSVEWQGGDGGRTATDPSQWKQWADTIPTHMLPVQYSFLELDVVLRLVGRHDLAQVARMAMNRYFNESQVRLVALESRLVQLQKLACRVSSPSPSLSSSSSGVSSAVEDTAVLQHTKEKKESARAIVIQTIHDLAKRAAAKICPVASMQHGLVACPSSLSSANSTRQQQHNVLPALIGLGWNSIVRDIALPIVAYTFARGQEWKTWDVPDQVRLTERNTSASLVTSVPMRTLRHLIADSIVRRYGDDDDKATMMMMPTNATIGFWGNTQSLVDLFKQYFGEDTAMSVSQEQRLVYSLEWSSSEELLLSIDPDFLAALQLLPDDYDEAVYGLILRYWGMTMLKSAEVGGASEQMVRVRNCVWNGGIEMMAQFKIDLLASLYPTDYSVASLNKFYRDRRVAATAVMIGGDPSLARPDQWAERVKTLSRFPALVSVQLESYLPLLYNQARTSSSSSWLLPKVRNLERAIRESMATDRLSFERQANEAMDTQVAELKAKTAVWAVSSVSHWMMYDGGQFWMASQLQQPGVASGQAFESSRAFVSTFAGLFGPVGTCERNASTGMLRARTVHAVGSGLVWMSPAKQRDGEWVTSGCSTATQDWFCNRPGECYLVTSPFQLRLDCCMSCTVSWKTVCSVKDCYKALGSCDCPLL